MLNMVLATLQFVSFIASILAPIKAPGLGGEFSSGLKMAIQINPTNQPYKINLHRPTHVNPCCTVVGKTSTMSRVIVFFEGEVITIADPLPDYRLKDLIATYLLAYLSIRVAGVIGNEKRDAVVSNTGPNVESSLVLFFWPSAAMLYI